MNAQIDFLNRSEVKKFISEHVDSDPNELILNPPSSLKDHIKLVASQILARQKAKGKLDAWAKNYDLIMPPPLSIEQASSEATCQYKSSLISGRSLIDLTGGMGIDCLALSESFKNTTYVERQDNLCELFDHNATALGKSVKIVHADCLDYLQSVNSDLENTCCYLDPARRDSTQNRVFRIEDCSPNLIELMPLLKQKAKKVLVKFSPMLDIKAAITSISNIAEIHVVSVKNECKEVLLLVDFREQKEPSVKCVNLQSKHQPYAFTIQHEHTSSAQFGHLKSYIYEPNSSIMKAGAFNKISTDYNLLKLGENTHLYTSDELIRSFPGRIFNIISAVNRKTIGEFVSKGRINVITRNYPLSAPELKKKWKLKDGGDHFLIGYKGMDNRPQTVIAIRADL